MAIDRPLLAVYYLTGRVTNHLLEGVTIKESLNDPMLSRLLVKQQAGVKARLMEAIHLIVRFK